MDTSENLMLSSLSKAERLKIAHEKHTVDNYSQYELYEFWEAMNYRIVEGLLVDSITDTDDDKFYFWKEFVDYATWCKMAPLKKNELIRGGANAGTTMEVDVARPMKYEEYILWMGLTGKEFKRYISDETDWERMRLLRIVVQAIVSQKYDLALIGTYNYKMIMAEMGMKDLEEDKPTIVIQAVAGRSLAREEDEVSDAEFTYNSVDVNSQNTQTAIPITQSTQNGALK